MFLMRSWVIGRWVGIFSSSRAMALASCSPTQIDSDRLSSSSRRTIIGMLDSGSRTRFFTFISSHMALLLEDSELDPARAALGANRDLASPEGGRGKRRGDPRIDERPPQAVRQGLG